MKELFIGIGLIIAAFVALFVIAIIATNSFNQNVMLFSTLVGVTVVGIWTAAAIKYLRKG